MNDAPALFVGGRAHGRRFAVLSHAGKTSVLIDRVRHRYRRASQALSAGAGCPVFIVDGLPEAEAHRQLYLLLSRGGADE